MPTRLTATNVREMFKKCLHTDDEVKELGLSQDNIPEGTPMAKGIMINAAFHAGRLEESRVNLIEMLNQLPDNFHKSKGGGMSFLSMCMDKDDNQWGEHPNMDELCILAIASGLGRYCMDREMWNILPGGMPYVVFDTESTGDDKSHES